MGLATRLEQNGVRAADTVRSARAGAIRAAFAADRSVWRVAPPWRGGGEALYKPFA
jgi:hypothetical protein